MAHDRGVITDTRIVRVETLYDDHSQEGRYFDARSAIRHDGNYWMAFRSAVGSGRFHLRRARKDSRGHIYQDADEPHGVVYRPIAPGQTPEDIEGATYVQDDGSHWHFAHCSPGEQIQYAARAEAFTVSQFDLWIASALTTLASATDATTRTAARNKVNAMRKFALLAGRRAHALVVSQTLGHYHRTPHSDHFRVIADACINAEYLHWIARTDLDTEALHVQTAVGDIRMRLSSKHTIEWRAARVKRLNAAAAARGEDPVAGREWCYTLSQTAAVITGASNLPDPTWPFDRLRTGTVGRGLFVYADAQPATNRLLSYVVPFWRPVPADTKPGADIGSVDWTQEAAYQP